MSLAFPDWERVARIAARRPEEYNERGVARRGQGEPLCPDVRARLESSFRVDLSGVRVHRGPAARALTARLGAAACAHGDDLYFAPGCYEPATPAGLWLLAHEMAHTIQQRGGMGRPGTVGPVGLLEDEADDAAWAVLSGDRATVRPRPGCPALQPALPALVVWGLVAAAVGAVAAAAGGRDESDPHPEKELYETGWGFIPFVGSIDQALHGRTALGRFFGGAMLVLDMSMLGGVVVKGAVVALRGAPGAIRMLLRGGGAVAGNEAMGTLLQNGVRFGSKQRAALALHEATLGKSAIIASTEGGLNHSVTYAVHEGQFYRMHGGPLGLFFRSAAEQSAARQGLTTSLGRPLSAELLSEAAGRMNTVSIYQVAPGTAKGVVDFWASQIAAGRLNLFARAQGCAGTQAMLLQAGGLGIPGAAGWGGSALSPLFPVFLDAARTGTPGVHYIINSAVVRSGTAKQMAVYLGLQATLRGVNYLNNWADSWVYQATRQADSLILPNPSAGPIPTAMLERIDAGQFAAELDGAVAGNLFTPSPMHMTIDFPPEVHRALQPTTTPRRSAAGAGGGRAVPAASLSIGANQVLGAVGNVSGRLAYRDLLLRLPQRLADGSSVEEAVSELELYGFLKVERAFMDGPYLITYISRLR